MRAGISGIIDMAFGDETVTWQQDEELIRPRDPTRRIGSTANCREVVAAFLAKRPARFTER